MTSASRGIDRLATQLGRGIIAGLVGTLAMTISSTLEMKLRGRKPSTVPGEAAGKVLGVQPRGKEERVRFSNLVHFAYGTTWGIPRAMLGALGLNGLTGTATHFAAVWGNALVMQPALGVTPTVKEWRKEALAIDALHHAVYATAATIAYQMMK